MESIFPLPMPRSAFLLAFLWLPLLCSAVPLDMAGIKAVYREGDLDAVRENLEHFLRKNGDSATREERIFAYKYLGVVYAAQATARARAETYFSRALDLSPDLGLAEMYASREIEEIFRETKATHAAKAGELRRVDEFGNPVAAPLTSTTLGERNLSPKGKKPLWPWMLGAGAMAAAAGAGVYLWLGTGAEDEIRVISAGN